VPSKVQTTSPAGALDAGSFKHSPLERVRTLYVGFIQGLFRASPPGAYHWDADNESTEILITDESPVKLDTIGVRPAISVTRGPVQFFSLGFDDMLSYDFQTGRKTKSILVPGTMAVNCLSRVDIEADRLAWIVAENLLLHREMLMKLGFFEIGRRPAVGAPSPAGSLVMGDNADEYFVVTVTCPYQFYRTSQVTPLGVPILQHIEATLRARLLPIGGNCGVPANAGVDVPVGVTTCFPPHFSEASDVNGGTPNPGFPVPVLLTAPHPMNPSQLVTVRSSRPNCPAVKPPSIGGRTIPLSTTSVEESCGKQMNNHVTDSSTVKV